MDGAGRLAVTTPSQVTVELTLANGELNGMVRSPDGETGVISGALDTRSGSERLANLSVRTVTSPGAAMLITGFVVSGTTAKQVLVRAAGPALSDAPFNIANAIANPSLQLFRGTPARA